MRKGWLIGIMAMGTLLGVAAEGGRVHARPLVAPMDTAAGDSLRDDTLRSVIVTPDGRIPVPMRKPPKQPSVPSVSDILGEKLTDMIMHPFAFSKRKRERHRKKLMKILKEYEQLKTPREQLIEALRKDGINVDSLLQVYEKKEE